MTMPTTRIENPPTIPSDEAKAKELDMARRQGDSFGEALERMIAEVADDGQEKQAGPYLVGYAVERPEGMYMPDENGDLVWHEPGDENAHLEISVRDAADGRFIPYLTIHARLTDSQGNDVAVHEQPFIWHPWLFHYGRNWRVPADGDYRLEVDIKAATFPRHDKENGRRFEQDVHVEFPVVKIETKSAES
jgi:uncharacterized protein involved in high-affinity Fe2+ transport